MRVDLHTHSRVSDGTDSPGEVVRAAVAAGLDVVALTDHDTAAGWPEALAAGVDLGIAVVPGMEISTRYDGHGLHLLAYLPDPTYPPLVAELERILSGRSERVPAMVARLREMGIAITAEDVFAQSSEAAATGRPHVADVLVALGVVPDRTAAFDTYLAAGRGGFVDRYAAPLVPMIHLVAAAGGVTVIAHPWGRHGREEPSEEALAGLVAEGLGGIEVDHLDHPPAAREKLRAIARNLGLIATGSSDYHGTGKTGHPLGVNTTAPAELERLLARAAAAAAAAGRRTPDVMLP